MIYQEKRLRAHLGGLCPCLEKYRAIVAGGCITSLFCNREINDVDIYVRDEESLKGILKELNGCFVLCHTPKATLFSIDDKQIQIIHIAYYKDAQSIFDSFDFTVCMGAYDFGEKKFILHPDFLTHNAARLLAFNGNTKFPIVSALRVQKYKEKGYHISKPEFIRVILACMALSVSSYAELKEHLGGMYGVNLDSFFDESIPFSLPSAMGQLSGIGDAEKMPQNAAKKFDYEDLLESIPILSKKLDAFKCGDKVIVLTISGKLREALDTDDINLMPGTEFFSVHPLYKYVHHRDDGRYVSHYKPSFEYKLHDFVSSDVPGIHCGIDKESLMFSDETLIRLEIPSTDVIISIDDKTLRLSKAYFAEVVTECS